MVFNFTLGVFVMNDKLNSIFSSLDISKDTGLATDETIDEMTSYQRLCYYQLKNKLGIDAVYFLRDPEGIAKIPMIYFSMIDDGDATKAAQLHSLSWNVGEAPLLFVVTPTELKIYNNYELFSDIMKAKW